MPIIFPFLKTKIVTQAGPWLMSGLLLNSDIAERDSHSWFGVSFRRKTRRSTSGFGVSNLGERGHKSMSYVAASF